MPPHILLIEDNADIANVVQYELNQAGCNVVTAPDGLTGLIYAREQPPQLVILDLGLPDFDGAEVARRLRKTSTFPIIILTAVDAVDRKVGLLEAGANDYLTKPFHPEELVARVKVQLRQYQGGAEMLSYGTLEIHTLKRQVTYDGRPIELSPKEYELLLLLARQPGRVYSRQEIDQKLWNGQLSRHSNVVDVHMGNLRNKLRSVGGYSLLRTVRGVGYGLKVPG
ncbi:response regulator transcription factor [Deinococcus hopiensis]|uniref:DNA-binding response regulator, OmpR family, contains REC and winged-helix (WHTH) domain n=1 Tax=Deinococcus hopiensis KR-140 TaxID=695939 RepID=A0A1W1URR0_9DEIO|nr:response regulator transcription factor [Deinococcus hopiensis]SMB83404.1 DNA-binding response regulator, OmpR family, contains REC and winged-helix (wHTH) domain [Deinococcus hopiensis KR-140]